MIDYHISLNMKNLIVVAHPDDEILWFSSILKEPDTGVIFCFQNKYPSHIGEEFDYRKYVFNFDYTTKVFKIIKMYKSLDIPVVWLQTITTLNPRVCGEVHPSTENHLKENLQSIISLIEPVKIYTHNPWGEYGHQEHILLHKVLQKLRKDIIFPGVMIDFIEETKKKIDTESILDKLILFKTNPVDISLRKLVFSWYKKLDIWTGEYLEKYINNKKEEFLVYAEK